MAATRLGVNSLWNSSGLKLGLERNHFGLNIFGGLSDGKSKSAGLQIDYKIGKRESGFTPYISIQSYYSFEPVIAPPALHYHYESVNSRSYGAQLGFYFSILPNFRIALSSGFFHTHQRYMAGKSVYFERQVQAPGFSIEGVFILRSEKKSIPDFPESDLGKPVSKRNTSVVFNWSPSLFSLGELRILYELRTEMDLKRNLFAGLSIVTSTTDKKPFPTDLSRFGLSLGPGYRFHIGNNLTLLFLGKLGYYSDYANYGFLKIKSGYFLAGISERIRYYFPRVFLEAGVEANQYLNFGNHSFNFTSVNVFGGIGFKIKK